MHSQVIRLICFLAQDSDSEWDSPSTANDAPNFGKFDTEIRTAIKNLGGTVFPKLNWSSPKVILINSNFQPKTQIHYLCYRFQVLKAILYIKFKPAKCTPRMPVIYIKFKPAKCTPKMPVILYTF